MYVYPNIILKKQPHGLNRFLAKRTLLSREEMRRQNRKVIATLVAVNFLLPGIFITLGVVLSIAALCVVGGLLAAAIFVFNLSTCIDIDADVEHHDGCATSLKLLLLGKKEGRDYIDVDNSTAIRQASRRTVDELSVGSWYDSYGHPHLKNMNRIWCYRNRDRDDLITSFLDNPTVQQCEKFISEGDDETPEVQTEVDEWRATLDKMVQKLYDDIEQRELEAKAQASAARDMWLLESRTNREVLGESPEELL